MSEEIDDITIAWEEEGIEVVKETGKVVLSRGAWTTILFKYQEWNKNKDAYGPDKYSIRRYQKRFDAFQQKSKFNISSADQAQKIIAALSSWVNEAKDQQES
jgi:hypothetical protein